MSHFDKKTPVKVCKDYPLYQSEKGRYFIGQTPILSGKETHALAALVNPIKSKRNIYVNAMTISNASGLNISAEFYLHSSFSDGKTSDLVSCSNTATFHKPDHKGKIKYLSSTAEPPNGGVAIFGRIVSPYTTLVVDGGQIILGPGQSIIIYLGGTLPVAYKSVNVAFGWYEIEFGKHKH